MTSSVTGDVVVSVVLRTLPLDTCIQGVIITVVFENISSGPWQLQYTCRTAYTLQKFKKYGKCHITSWENRLVHSMTVSGQ